MYYYFIKLAYRFKLKPTKPQQATFATWIELCRRQFNHRLAERYQWYEATRTAINACPLVVPIQSVKEVYHKIPLTRTLIKGKRKGQVVSTSENGYVDWVEIQRADLKNTKALFPEYEQLDSQVLQNVIERVEYAFSRFIKPDKHGKRNGKPRFWGQHYYHSFTYPQLSNSDITKDERGRDCVNLKKIGFVPIVLHRPISFGFKVKTGTILREPDGFYLSLSL